MMLSWLLMKRLQHNRPAQKTTQPDENQSPELPVYITISEGMLSHEFLWEWNTIYIYCSHHSPSLQSLVYCQSCFSFVICPKFDWACTKLLEWITFWALPTWFIAHSNWSEYKTPVTEYHSWSKTGCLTIFTLTIRNIRDAHWVKLGTIDLH